MLRLEMVSFLLRIWVYSYKCSWDQDRAHDLISAKLIWTGYKTEIVLICYIYGTFAEEHGLMLGTQLFFTVLWSKFAKWKFNA